MFKRHLSWVPGALLALLVWVVYAAPAAAIESAARANAYGANGGAPLSAADQQDDLGLVTASAAVVGGDGSASASVIANALHGTLRFSLSSNGLFGSAAILGAFTESVSLTVPGAAPGDRTPFSLHYFFDGTTSSDPASGGYTLAIGSGMSGVNIETAVPGITTQEFDDGQFESPLRDPFTPFNLDLQGSIVGSSAQLFIELVANALTSGNAALDFSHTLGFRLQLPAGVIAISDTSGSSPIYATPLPASVLSLAAGLCGLLPLIRRQRTSR